MNWMDACRLRVIQLGRMMTVASVLVCGTLQGAVAQPLFFPSEKSPIEVQQLLQGPLPPPSSSSKQPSQSGLTLPSLWWVDRQFGQKLVIDWFGYKSASPQAQQVQMFVRSNLWTRFSYLERYAFVTHFGALTRTYGYQMLLLDTRGYLIASYICDFEAQQPEVVIGAQDAQNQPIPSYTAQDELPCDLWMSNAFPRSLL